MESNEHPYFRSRQRIEDYWDLVSQTAEFRYRLRWSGARTILSERGFDPLSTILVFCEQGDDIAADFVLPDGTLVCCNFREDPSTRQAVSITNWNMQQELSPGEVDTNADIRTFGSDIARDLHVKDAFDRAVLAYYDFHFRFNDPPLPKG